MVLIRSLVLVACLAAVSCAKRKFIKATAPPQGVEGIRLEVEGGGFLRDAGARLENVGTYVSMPENWTGPLPPGWTRQDGAVVGPGE